MGMTIAAGIGITQLPGRAAAGRAMTIDDLLAAVRVTDPQLSPDGSRVLFVRTTTDLKTGKRLAPSRLWVYDRAGRPCHRCGTLIQVESQGSELPRTTYWCPSCQASVVATPAKGRAKRQTSGASA